MGSVPSITTCGRNIGTGIRDPLYQDPNIQESQGDTSSRTVPTCIVRRGHRFVRERRYRTSCGFRIRRVLLKLLSSPQENRGFAPNSQPEAYQWTDSQGQIQDGIPAVGYESYGRRGVVGVSRPQRCVLSRTHTPQPLEVPTVLHSRSMLPVPGTSIRPYNVSMGLHTDPSSGHCIPQETSYSSFPVLGRHTIDRQVTGGIAKTRTIDSRSAVWSWLHNQQQEIQLESVSGHGLSRSSFPDDPKSHFIASEQGREYGQFGSVVPPRSTILRAQVADTPGSHGINHTNGKDGQTPYETRPVISSLNMEQKQARPRIQGRGNPRSVQSHSVVDGSGQPAPWASSSPELSNARHYDGRIPTRVGRSSGGRRRGGGGSILTVQGRWKPVQMTWHINRLELMAVRLTLLHFHEQVRGHRVLVRSDNSTTCYYINKFGGTRSQELCCLTWDLLMWCSERGIELTAIHVPGVDNVLADFLSRQEINQREWSLHGHVTNMIFKIWGRPNIDLFASVHNHKLPVYCSLLPCPAALSRNAFSINWGCCYSSYAFPPPVLLHKVLQKIRQDRARVILIAPMWPMRSWYSSILNMLVQSPLILPLRPDLLSQFKILHPKATQLQAGGLEGQWDSLRTQGFSEPVVGTMSSSRAKSTLAVYSSKWAEFSRWCGRQHLDPHATTVVDVCEFLQFKFEQGLQHQTIKGYVAAIQASHKHFQENSLGKDVSYQSIFTGVFRLRPPVKAIVPTWDLSLVLQVLANEPFEPPSRASLKHWTQKQCFW